MSKYLIFFLPFLLFGQKNEPQDDKMNVNKYKSLISSGDKYFFHEKYYQAIQDYFKASKMRQDDPYLDFQLAESCRLNGDYDDAEFYYDKIVRKYGKQNLLAKYWLGVMQKTNGKYYDAENSLAAFIKTYKPIDAEGKARVREASFEHKGCLMAIESYKKPIKDVDLRVLTPPVNSRNSDYAPMIFSHDSCIVITSARADAKGKELNVTSGEAKSDNFRFEKQGERWERYHNEDNFDIVNTTKDDGAGELTRDRKKYYYTICDPNCAIYVSKVVNGKFTPSIRLNENINPKFDVHHDLIWNAQPTLSPRADTMLFVSKRSGGKGLHDIWMCVNVDKKGIEENWGPAINVKTLNSPGIEIAPYWDDITNQVYISSNGHIGFGGLDVYRTSGRKREKLENIGLPFNSSRDDIYFILGHEKGYLVSNRKGGIGLTDIYTFNRTPKEAVIAKITKSETFSYKQIEAKGRVFYSDVGESLEGAIVFLKDSNGNIIEQTTTDASGEFRFYGMKPGVDYQITLEGNDPRFSSTIDFLGDGKSLAKPSKNTIAKNIELAQNQSFVNTEAEDEFFKTVKKMSKQKAAGASITSESVLDKTVEENEKIILHDEAKLDSIAVDIDQTTKQTILKKYKKGAFENVYFEYNSFELTSAGKIVMDSLAKFYKAHDVAKIEIKAYTDSYGDFEYNKTLAEQRSKVCHDYLRESGVDEMALVVTSVGADNPIASNHSLRGRQLNRRVEFILKGTKGIFYHHAMAYVVEPKETLFTIAQKFKMSLEEIIAMNGLKTNDLKAYSTIRVKGESSDIIAPMTFLNLKESKTEYKYQDSKFIPLKSAQGNGF